MGQLRYLADKTRPDLLYSVNFLSRHMHQPSNAVYAETHRLLQYLKHTINHELIIGGSEINLFAMSDASFIHTDGSRSQSGYIIFLCPRSGGISLYSKRASTVALS